MHPNPAFRQADAARNIAFVRAQGFGLLAVATGDPPLISHIPFLLSEDGTRAEFHLVRSNPIARLMSDPLPARLAPKPEWRAEKMTPEVRERMMRQIVPCEMRVDEIAGTWKLGQNKPEDVRLRAADPLESAGQGQEVAMLARLMRCPPA